MRAWWILHGVADPESPPPPALVGVSIALCGECFPLFLVAKRDFLCALIAALLALEGSDGNADPAAAAGFALRPGTAEVALTSCECGVERPDADGVATAEEDHGVADDAELRMAALAVTA